MRFACAGRNARRENIVIDAKKSMTELENVRQEEEMRTMVS